MSTNTKQNAPQNNHQSLSGHFLIAMPSLADGHFNQSVTYLCEHDENGCFGIVLNNPTDISLQQVLNEMKIEGHSQQSDKKRIHLGGPVETGRGFVLHSPVGKWQSSLKINDTLALTTSKDIMQALANNEGPEQVIIALGYAGWAAGQLEQEMAANSWLSCPAEQQIIFDTPADKLWQTAANIIGIDMQLLSQDSGHA